MLSVVFVVVALVHGLLGINGQCTMHRCPQDSDDRSFVGDLEQHDQRLRQIQRNISTRLEELEGAFRSSIQDLKENYLDHKAKAYCSNTPVVCDCAEIKASGGGGVFATGTYRIRVNHRNKSHYADVACDMTTDGKGWIVFQRRKDGNEDFYRGWSDYANGFGNSGSDFWLGNEFLHILTTEKKYRLRVDLEDFNKAKKYAEYSDFSVASSLDKYRLTVGGYTGNAGDSLEEHNKQQFSSWDADNDSFSPMDNHKNASTNCAVRDKGGWWYNACHKGGANLNGHYYSSANYTGKSVYEDGITWSTLYDLWHSLKATEMKISPA